MCRKQPVWNREPYPQFLSAALYTLVTTSIGLWRKSDLRSALSTATSGQKVIPDVFKDTSASADSAIKGTACKPGFVWRVARPQDLVCVTSAARSRTARENAEAASHVNPAGASGPNTCVSGFVWRAAFEGDRVCVTEAAPWNAGNSAASRRLTAGLTNLATPTRVQRLRDTPNDSPG